MSTEWIPFNRPFVAPESAEQIVHTLEARRLSGAGPLGDEAERLLSPHVGGGRALLTTSGTHALELMVHLIGIKPGDEVIVPSFTFSSTAAAVVMAGGTPVFVDVDDFLAVHPDRVAEAVTPKTRAVIVVHYAGIPGDLSALRDVTDDSGITLLEDNAHGLGASFQGKPLGSLGLLSAQSFHETKNIQCGEGGAVIVNDDALVERAEVLREKGTNRSRFFRGEVDKYTWIDTGSSWVMSEILAGVLVTQLRHFNSIQARRHRVWGAYHDGLSDWAATHGVLTPQVPTGAAHPAHLYFLRLPTGLRRADFIGHLSARGIHATFHYQPLHSSTAGQRFGRVVGDMATTDALAENLVRLPLWPEMTEAQIGRVVEAVQETEPA